ncbi:MAG: FG-GAP repeat domain-containing protein [Verrucomicrobiales bacterium]
MCKKSVAARAAALGLVVSGLIGCGKQDDVSTSQGDATLSAGQELTTGSKESLTDSSAANLGTLPTKTDPLQYHQRLADELSKVNPDEGWESEAFTESASDRMKTLGKWLTHPEELDTAGIRALIAEDFTSSPLLTNVLTTAAQSPAMSVRRAASVEGPAQQGVDSFTAQLRSLAQILDGAEQRRVKFKIMHVELQAERVVTRMLFEMRGRKPDGWMQVSSTWHCDWRREGPILQSVRVSDYQEVRPGDAGRIEFVDAAPIVLKSVEAYEKQLAPGFDYWRARSDRSLVADLLGAQGVAVGDVNGDLLDDIYVLQQGGLPNRLFLHQPDGTAVDISRDAGVDILDFCRSAVFADLDNDGDQDLAVGMAWKVVFLQNDGNARYTRRGEFPSEGQINSMAAADYDNDGDLDLYLCGRDASGEIKAEQGALGIPMPYYDANNGGPNTLLENSGGFAFANVTKAVGMDVNNRRFSLACSWEDYDNDGDQDLYVANDFGRNNLWRNSGKGADGKVTFHDVAERAGVVDIGPGMSAAWGDHNNDGLMDLYVGNMWSNAGNRITLQAKFLPGADEGTKQQARRHARGNSLYVNNGDGTFRDATVESGANMARWAWSSNFIDLNNDGWQDLVVGNGMITANDTGDL